ncbi:MAG: hypothetical protein B7Z02_10300 [Rhodobacterales bacterium 32-67-9]|nr:MAG: hypothetical protein B7Z02_10300 [Rhodobacterales bacterium 32-67-9]
MFVLDKRQAQSAGRRISEATLLRLAFIGGSLGAKLAQHRLRHKTRKEPFRSNLNMIVALHAVIWAAMMLPPVRIAAFEAISSIVASAISPEEPKPDLPRRFGPGSSWP